MAWNLFIVVAFCQFFSFVFGNFPILIQDKSEQRTEMIVDLIKFNTKSNGWHNILIVGNMPDSFYAKIKLLNYTISITNVENDDHEVEEAVPYSSNTVLLSCLDFDEFEDALFKAVSSPFWHSLANVILYYHTDEEPGIIVKIFYILWFHRASNAIIVRYDDTKNSLMISYYSQFVTKAYELRYTFGCWKATKVGRPITGFKESFVCEEGCHNVTLYSKLRASNFGTCMSFDTRAVRYGDWQSLQKHNFFEEKALNLHGYVFRAFGVEVLPFLEVAENSDGTYKCGARDGQIWTVIAALMNFTMDFAPSRAYLQKPFNFQIIIENIFSFATRVTDLMLMPLYQMDMFIMEIDRSIAYLHSGVCVMSHRADFETALFDGQVLKENYMLVVEFACCFLAMWLTFFAFEGIERRQFNFDRAGKAFVNTIKNVLSISLKEISKRRSFRFFLTATIWSFFVINFATQAAIISLFTTFKRGKDVDSFDDVIEKGYVIEGIGSPDIRLPETDERNIKINSMFVATLDLYECIRRMTNDSRRFCLIDCSVGYYLERNMLNEKGEQYLHIATKDRIHSHYMNMIFHKDSPLTKTYNKYLRIFVEAGLVQKWEQYRFNDMKKEGQVNALSMEDLKGIFKSYYVLLGISFSVFVLEVAIGIAGRIRRWTNVKVARWRRTRVAKKKLKLEKKLGAIKHVNTYTQTN